MTTAYIDYEILQSALAEFNCVLDAAEADGLLKGITCSGCPFDGKSWLPYLEQYLSQGEPLPQQALQVLGQLYVETCRSLAEFQFDLQLVIADDSYTMSKRAETLALWCQGFLAGFGLIARERQLFSEEVTDALSDLKEISLLDSKISDDDENNDENDFMQIAEHVRLAAQLIFTECGDKSLAPKDDDVLN